MSHVIDQINALQAQIKSLQPISADRQKAIDKKFRLEFNYNSNHMEGNTLTYGETEVLLIFGDTSGGHNIREYDEMRNHDVAFKLVEEWAEDKERPLTEQNIKNLNKIILVEPFWKEAITPDGQPTRRLISIGNYKNHSNSVRLQNGEIFQYSSPAETPVLMGELMEWYRSEEDKLHPVVLASMLHYKLVRIHPFDDGNGRVARLLLNYVLLRNSFPPVIIKSDDKANYLRVLHLADADDYEPLIEYISEQLIWSQKIVIKGAKGENIDEPGDFERRLKVLMSRLNTDETSEIRVTKSKVAIANAWKDSLRPLLARVQLGLSKLNVLFKSSTLQIGFSAPTYSDSFNDFLDVEIAMVEHEPNAIEIGYHFSGLRKSKQLDLSEWITISFYTNVYEITSKGLVESTIKLYDESFTEAEVKSIIESIGNNLLNVMEDQLENKKGR